MKEIDEYLRGLNILYAEDHEKTRENIQKTLSLLCDNVIAIDNGVDALKIYRQKPIDIVILDYVLPLMDGCEVAREVREDRENIPIIIISSHADKEKLMNAMTLGLIDYIEKPVSFERLRLALVSAVQRLIKSNGLSLKINDHIEYSYLTKSLVLNGTQSVTLTKNEHRFIELLLKKKNGIVTTDEIEFELFEGLVIPNTLRNMVYRLRKKIEVDFVVTIKDIGYSIVVK